MTDIQEVVMSDGDSQLGVWFSASIGPGAFGLVMSDGGGYSSLMIRPSDWDVIKRKVDGLLAKHMPSGHINETEKS